MPSNKKVMIFIVEGPSDEAALGSVLKEYFSSDELSFYVTHGDITSRPGITGDNVIREINRFVKSVKDRYRYLDQDILRIVHIVDTDGVFVNDGCVRERLKRGPVLYYTDHIEANSVDDIRGRNHAKANLLQKLYRTETIGKAAYRLYYLSCNLEHVLYNELREYTDEEKWRFSDEFAEKYDGKAEEFALFLEDSGAAVGGTYDETWKFIQDDVRSLNRYTNLQRLFAGDDGT